MLFGCQIVACCAQVSCIFHCAFFKLLFCITVLFPAEQFFALCVVIVILALAAAACFKRFLCEGKIICIQSRKSDCKDPLFCIGIVSDRIKFLDCLCIFFFLFIFVRKGIGGSQNLFRCVLEILRLFKFGNCRRIIPICKRCLSRFIVYAKLRLPYPFRCIFIASCRCK